MANVLTALAPTLFAAARIVPNELTGLLGAVNRDFNDQGVSKGGTVLVTKMQAAVADGNTTPSMTWPAGTDTTAATVPFVLNQIAKTSWNYTGEDERQLLNSGTAQEALRQQVEQGIRYLRNQIETYLGATAILNASRAIGTAGTVPFGTDAGVIPDLIQILKDNGAPTDVVSLVISTAAGAKFQKLSNLYKVNEAGSDALLRDGILGRLYKADIRESAGIGSHTAGTGTSYVNDGALAIGTTSIPIDVGTGTVLAGDIVTFAGDTNKYVVATGVAAPGTIVIQEPGLRKALADDTAMTIGSTYTGHILITKPALAAIVRPAIQPPSPDVDQMVVTDPKTQFSFLMTRKVGYKMSSWYMECVYDAFSPNPFGMATLLG